MTLSCLSPLFSMQTPIDLILRLGNLWGVVALGPVARILGDPGVDNGGEGKSKRAEKYIWNEEK